MTSLEIFLAKSVFTYSAKGSLSALDMKWDPSMIKDSYTVFDSEILFESKDSSYFDSSKNGLPKSSIASFNWCTSSKKDFCEEGMSS